MDAANNGTLRPERAAARLAHGQGTQRGEIPRRGTAARQSGLVRAAQHEQAFHPALPQFGDAEIPDALAQGLLQGIGRAGVFEDAFQRVRAEKRSKGRKGITPQTSMRKPQAATPSAIHCGTVRSPYFRCGTISFTIKRRPTYGTKKESEERKGCADCPGREDRRNQRGCRTEKGRHPQDNGCHGSQQREFLAVRQEQQRIGQLS